MTVNIGLIENGEVYLGADTQETGDFKFNNVIKVKRLIKEYPSSKVEMLLTGNGSAGPVKVIYECLELPEYEYESPYIYMIKKFIPAVKKLLDNYDMLESRNSIKKSKVNFIVAFMSKLFQIDSYWCVSEYDHFITDGIGGSLALGAMEQSFKLSSDMEPYERIRQALDIACKYSIGCSGPYTIEKL
ncbi:MAG: hypothetical protein PVI90_04740 [Desulfobacteraceae bacterium]|jgi:ATP-dependent protease HslVU (ClpYQ) peptidase subunit